MGLKTPRDSVPATLEQLNKTVRAYLNNPSAANRNQMEAALCAGEVEVHKFRHDHIGKHEDPNLMLDNYSLLCNETVDERLKIRKTIVGE